jgi:hypothetical protein
MTEINIENKINKLLDRTSFYINKKTANYFSQNKDCIENNILDYSRKLAIINFNKNQYIFNYIFNCTINYAIKLYKKNLIFFYKDFGIILQNKRTYYLDIINILLELKDEIDLKYDKINYELYYIKLIYIFFYYFGIKRSLIQLLYESRGFNKIFNLEKKIKSKSKPINFTKPINFNELELENINMNIIYKQKELNKLKTYYSYGMINSSFYYKDYYIQRHPIRMERLNNYIKRIKTNINLLNITFNYIDIEQEYGYTNIKIYLTLIDIIPFYKVIDKYIYLFISYHEVNNTITGNLGNVSEYLKQRLNILNILSYCLYKLDELYTERNRNKDFIIKYIILFYYLIIFLMPFEKGTASIAEMSLYLLSKYYIEKNLIINPNILLDVEALTLPFDIFYENCLNHKDDYTPYFSYE